MTTETLTIKRPKLAVARPIHISKKAPGALKIKNVLVALDFSPASHHAIRSAVPWLKRFGAKLHLVHVLPPEVPFSALADLPVVVPEIEIGRRIRRDLGKAAENCGINTTPAQLHIRRGSPFSEICALARDRSVDLIVITTRGLTGLKHLVLGSTAERIVRYSPCPVLVVREQTNLEKPERNGDISRDCSIIKRILVPVDFSDHSARNVSYASRLAKEFEATLILMHSVPFQYFITSDEYVRYDFPLLMELSEKYAREQMQELAARTARAGVRVEQAIEIGHAGQEICARADAERADLIVTSTHGWTGLKHVLVGSTAEYVVRHATTPVLVVPSHDRPIPR